MGLFQDTYNRMGGRQTSNNLHGLNGIYYQYIAQIFWEMPSLVENVCLLDVGSPDADSCRGIKQEC